MITHAILQLNCATRLAQRKMQFPTMTCFGYTEKFPLLKDHVVVLLQAFAKKYNSTVTAAGTEVLKNAFERKMPTVLARINKGSP